MFGSSSRTVLTPSKALQLFDVYMEYARRTGGSRDDDIVMELCLDADSALSRIQKSVKKALASPTSKEEAVLRQDIGSAYYELARIFERLGRAEDAQRHDKKAEKWGYVHGSVVIRQAPSINNTSNTNTNVNKKESNDTNAKTEKAPKPMGVRATTIHTSATIPKEIFDCDVPPTAVRYSLPGADDQLNDTHQLVYCLSLLPNAPFRSTDLTDNEQQWVQEMSNDREEQERLRNLISDVISQFASDEIKAEATVAEVVSLAPILSLDQFRSLLMALVNGISQNIMLETHLLEGLAELMQRAPPGYLDPDDLVTTLTTLSSRLQSTHDQSGSHLYHLSVTVSHVLDAMVNNQVKGLKREQLYEPLAAYLKGLKGSSDPHLVYQAAYASQALLYIPDDETTMQAMLRRTSAVLRGVFGVVSAVKGLDLNGFMDEISNIQEELPSITDIIDMSLGVYEGATSLYESGAAFRQSMEEGLSFSRKTAWYPALRTADALLQTGELTRFKVLVCEASCRRDPAFQWGLCERLGQIAAGKQWTVDTRKDAIEFLGEIYMNDQDWGCHVHIKQWIINILRKLTLLPMDGLQAASIVLNRLEKDGDIKKQELFRNCVQEPATQFSYAKTLPPSTSTLLLDRAQNRPDIEKSLRQLKRNRMKDRDFQSFYIQQYAKPSPQARDDKLFLLMDKAKEFLEGDQKVLLVQGGSGAGKSTFNRTLESILWKAYKRRHGRIPLFINLPAIDNPEKDLVTKQLRDYGFTDPEIKDMKKSRSFVLICDGYDESLQTRNLYVTNRLNQPGEWIAQMVISCRSEYLGLDYRDRFQPLDRNQQAEAGLFQEAVIVPFSEAQIDDYIEQYVAAMDPMWAAEDYRRALKMVPSLHELVKNPFLLSLSLEVLPRMVDPSQDIINSEIRRVSLYDQFVELWLERGKKRLGETLAPEDRRMFRILTDEGFAQNGIRYLTDLAIALYKYQNGNPVVDYSAFKDRGTWKEEFFSREDSRYLLREASPLSRTGNQHRFIHRSILEYSLARAVYEPQQTKNVFIYAEEAPRPRRRSISSVFSFEVMEINTEEQEVDSAQADETSPLVWRSFVDEPSILQFLEDRARLEPVFKQQLYNYVELSKSDAKWRIAAANAMTILVRAGESFIEADLRGIQIGGADISQGIFEFAQLQRADLRKATLRNCWLRKADLTGAKMDAAQLGEWPVLREKGWAKQGAYSFDGSLFTALIGDGSIVIYDTSTWEKHLTLNDIYYACESKFSPDCRQIASWDEQDTVLIWDTTSGELIHSFAGHTEYINCTVYSPSGSHLVSACFDGSVRVWDTQSGVLQHTLEGHTESVGSVAYSPDGLQITTGDDDGMIGLWDAASGHQIMMLKSPETQIMQIVYSPDGQEIVTRTYYTKLLHVWDVTSGQQKREWKHGETVRGVQYSPNGRFVASFSSKIYQWNAKTGKLIHCLEGHSHYIEDLKYSPNGQQIATCSQDCTVMLWDARSGQLIHSFYGHSDVVNCVAYSPNNLQLASLGADGAIRLWDAESQQFSQGPHGYAKPLLRLRSSPNGQHVASCSNDGTICVWNIQDGQSVHVLQSHQGDADDIKYSPDGLLLASCHGTPRAYIWNTRTGQIVHALESQVREGDNIRSLDFSPTGHQIACGHASGSVTVWDTQTGQLVHTIQAHEATVRCVVFSPSGHQISTCDENGIIRVWTAQSASQYELDDTAPHNPYIIYTPDGRNIAFIRNLFEVQVCNTETGALCFRTRLEGTPRWMVLSPCGQQMAAGGHDGLVNVVDMESGAILHEFEGHTGNVTCIAFSPDSKYVATGSKDMTVRVWDLESGQCLITIPSVGGEARVLMWNVSEEGYSLVVGSQDASVRMTRIVQEDGQYQYRLTWSTRQTALYADNTCIQGVVGLSKINRKLLVERGAIGDQAPLPDIQKESKQTVATPSMTPELKAAISRMKHHQGTSAVTETLNEASSATSSAPNRSIKDYKFDYGVCKECRYAHVISCRPREQGVPVEDLQGTYHRTIENEK